MKISLLDRVCDTVYGQCVPWHRMSGQPITPPPPPKIGFGPYMCAMYCMYNVVYSLFLSLFIPYS